MNEKFTLWHISISWSLLKKLTALTMLALLFPLVSFSQYTNALGGWNGGGTGNMRNDINYFGGGGGGASDIRIGGTALTNRVVVAGGGGGGGRNGSDDDGGLGGGTTGGNGKSYDGVTVTGYGGTQTAGGAATAYSGWSAGTPGSLGVGGNAGVGTGGGGGGGGYYGGGGGSWCGGGGGSSYTSGICSSVVHTQGFQTGDGQVIISGIGFGTQTFNYTGTLQTFIVPAGVTSVTVDVKGGKGGGGFLLPSSFIDYGGLGGRVSADIAVSAGQTLNIYVGKKGENGGQFISCSITSSVAAQTNVSCNGGTNGAATISASGETTPYTYAWSPSGGSAATATNLSAGTYTCTITSANLCTKTQTVTITQPSALTVTSSQINVSCNGGANGSATVVASDGTAPYTYSWSPSGGTGATTTGRTAGAYTCTITDVNGCSTTKSLTITQPVALSATSSQINVTCNGGANGTATVVASSGTGAYTYSWSPSGGTGATTTGRTAGTYTCTITDANGCTLPKSITITQPGALVATAASQTNVSCNAGSNGAAAVSVTGGTAAYSYNWTPGNPTGDGTASVTGLTATTWTCTVTDANSCITTQSFTVTQPTALSLTPASQTNISCFGGSNGAASVNIATGGAGGYTYNWTPGNPTGDGTLSVTGLIAGTWICTATDANGCITTQSFTVTQPSGLVLTPASQTNIACNGGSTGAASVNAATGGTGTKTYNWTPGNPTGDGTISVTGLTAGTWTCTATDANGCTTVQSFTLSQQPALAASTLQTNVSCNGGSNGTATVSVSGGTPSYSYSWSPSGGTGATASGLSVGAYTCTITDANGCTITKSFTIIQPSALTGSTVVTPVACFGGSNGAINFTPSGGTPGYTFTWSSGSTTEDIIGLTAGTYSVVVTDANGCTKTISATVTQPLAIAATSSQVNVSCNGGSNGTATVVATGGVGSYSYAWSPSGGTGATASSLSVGAYTCIITDALGCTLTKSFTITQPSALTGSTVVTPVACFGGSNGAINLTPSGGTPGYTYNWGGGITTEDRTGLTAGTYSVVVTDANGCTKTVSATLTQPSALAATTSQTNVSCNGGTNGSATVVVSGGASAYTYSWSPSGGTGATASGLSAGAYTCTITDANGCNLTKTFTITQPAALAASTSQVNVSCNGGSNGSATVVVSGGVSAYTYSWSPSGGTGATASGLSAGAYTCTITDANGCTLTRSFTITQPSALAASTSQVNVICIGGNNGSASVVASGGTADYNYLWSPGGGTAATASGLTAGNYTCTITDANLCSITKSFSIIQSDLLNPVAVAKNVIIFLNNSGNATITASEINDGSTDNCSIASLSASKTDFTCADLGANNVTLTVTDASGNSSAAIAVVTLVDDLSPVADVSDLSDATGECSASVIAPTATDNCAGVITATTSDPLTYDAQGSYLIHWTYSDGNGNSSTQEQKVIVADATAPVADVAMLSDVTGECSASVIAPTATDNCAGVITATTSDPLTYEAQGSYIIHWTYSDGNGNSSTQEQKVIVADVTAPVADVAMLSDVTGECSASVIAPTATDNCAGVITATTSDPLTYDAQGSYLIHWTYSDGNGNSSTQEQKVIVADVTAPVADVAMLSDVTGECSASVIAPTATDNCAGVITATTSDPLTYDAQGSYIIHWTYSDGNGNSSTQEQKVIVADVTDPSIACTNDITVIAQESVGHYLIAGSAFDPESVTDNCGIKTLLNNVTNTSTLDGATLGVGSNVVTWTATDEAGNTSTCTTNITVQLNVGIPELNFKNVSVYPNPSKGMFTLEVPGSCTAVIYDVRGRIIQTEKMVDKLNKLDLTKCQQGVYLLKLIKDNQVVNMKLIVE